MQPLQSVLHNHVANPHLSTHMATPDDNNHAAIPLQSATTDSKNTWNYTQEQPLATQRRNTFATETTAAAPAAHTRYLSSPPAATLHKKINGFVLRLPPQHKPRATSIQPLQCVLQHHVANPHLSTHMATPNNKIMQPFHSDLQPQIQKTHGTTHTGTTTRNTEEEHIRDRNDRSRTRRTHEVPFIATCSHFTQKNKRFCAPASSPTQTPCNIHTAITMLFAASRGEPASLYAHGNTK